jgi:Histidine phosphatase superfamily (branch 1)
MPRRNGKILFWLVVLAMAVGASDAAADDAALWAALAAGGKVVVLRHAAAPGPQQGREGDPPGFRLDDCSTQRNLSDFGRQQAAKLGEEFRAHGVVVGKVMASPWCRAIDTANLMNLGPPVEVAPFLRNIGEHEGGAGAANRGFEDAKQMMGRLHGIIESWKGPGTLVMVSHGRTVAMLVYGPRSVSPEQATAIVLQPTPGARPRPFREIGALSPPGGASR